MAGFAFGVSGQAGLLQCRFNNFVTRSYLQVGGGMGAGLGAMANAHKHCKIEAYTVGKNIFSSSILEVSGFGVFLGASTDTDLARNASVVGIGLGAVLSDEVNLGINVYSHITK